MNNTEKIIKEIESLDFEIMCENTIVVKFDEHCYIVDTITDFVYDENDCDEDPFELPIITRKYLDEKQKEIDADQKAHDDHYSYMMYNYM